MDTNTQTTANTQAPLSEKLRHSKALIPTLAVMGVTVLALAAALVVNKSEAQPGGTDAVAKAEPAKQGSAAVTAKPAIKHNNTAPAVVAQNHKADACATCGTVESVVAVERQGQVNGVAVGNTTIGLGTVAGGVVGGLLGNQMGGGNGKTAMTVLGVAGGAVAGNAIEKNMKKVTVYQMRVRMHDGSIRTIEQPSAVQAGSRVIVEGNTLRLASTSVSSAAGFVSYRAALA